MPCYLMSQERVERKLRQFQRLEEEHQSVTKLLEEMFTDNAIKEEFSPGKLEVRALRNGDIHAYCPTRAGTLHIINPHFKRRDSQDFIHLIINVSDGPHGHKQGFLNAWYGRNSEDIAKGLLHAYQNYVNQNH